MPMSARRARRESGQVIVILVLSLFALIGMAGLVIDVGSAWANQRGVQNGADAAAEAGAIVLARRLAGATEPAGGWDAEVDGAIAGSAATNDINREWRVLHGHLRDPAHVDGRRRIAEP